MENFYTEYEDMFVEYIEDIKRYLRNVFDKLKVDQKITIL